MPSDQTRSAIFVAAERLYADHGFRDVSLRDMVAEANVNLAAVRYHFGSKDELIACMFVSQSLQLDRERLRELRAAEDKGRGVAGIADIIHALIGPSLRRCLGSQAQDSTAARFMVRTEIEPVPAILRIRSQDLGYLRKFIEAMRRALPGRREVELSWSLHFALAMALQTVRDTKRLTRLSEGKCDLDDVDGIIARVARVIVMAVSAGEAEEQVVVRTGGQLSPPAPRPGWDKAVGGIVHQG